MLKSSRETNSSLVGYQPVLKQASFLLNLLKKSHLKFKQHVMLVKSYSHELKCHLSILINYKASTDKNMNLFEVTLNQKSPKINWAYVAKIR